MIQWDMCVASRTTKVRSCSICFPRSSSLGARRSRLYVRRVMCGGCAPTRTPSYARERITLMSLRDDVRLPGWSPGQDGVGACVHVAKRFVVRRPTRPLRCRCPRDSASLHTLLALNHWWPTGMLVHKVTSPKHRTVKVYEVRPVFNGPPTSHPSADRDQSHLCCR